MICALFYEIVITSRNFCGVFEDIWEFFFFFLEALGFGVYCVSCQACHSLVCLDNNET